MDMKLKNNYNSCKSINFDILNYNDINNSNNYVINSVFQY